LTQNRSVTDIEHMHNSSPYSWWFWGHMGGDCNLSGARY